MKPKEFQALKPGDIVIFHRDKRNQVVRAEGEVADIPRRNSVPVDLTSILECDMFLIRHYTEGTQVEASPDELYFPSQFSSLPG